ncbi:MAG: 50S ribosomal protein L9, partial [Bacteroidales bacterium]|nr:50S ribosomal protein L9 [Bacteroidales bacterium]
MKIILKKEVANLGEAGDVVEVKTGYALNYLVPQGFASVGTPSALKQHAETLRQRAHKEAKLVADAQAAAAKIEAVRIDRERVLFWLEGIAGMEPERAIETFVARV